MDTFRETGQKMAKIASWSDELARRDGIVGPFTHHSILAKLTPEFEKIENILKFSNPNQDASKDRHLRRLLLLGRKKVARCAAAIKEIEERFDKWSEKTGDIFKALEETIGTYHFPNRYR